VNRASLFVPLGVFLLVVGFGYAGFKLNDPHELPSALLDAPFPAFSAPLLADPERRVQRDVLLGAPVLVNVWATWCPTCKAEHGELLRIAEETGLRIVGLNYKDDPQAARSWLRRFGDPYDLNLVDADGSIGVDLGVYGAPETFLLDARGVIRYKRVGEVTRRIWESEIAPRLAAFGREAS
jgi:cytochrome c biogenesis protein CcmG/thiol:disulfide interchange protein DsbE